MEMKDTTKHERKIFASFSDFDIRDILTRKLAEKTGFKIDPRKTMIDVRFRERERTGTSGFENYVEVTMINNLEEK